jgi:NADH dehydrogenase (ubiquinone) Fe-S protein 3
MHNNKNYLNINFSKLVSTICFSLIYISTITKNELTLIILPSNLVKITKILRDHTNTQFKVISDIIGIDYLNTVNQFSSARFGIIYQLLSLRYNARIQLKIFMNEYAMIPSITSIFYGANWLEREV